MILSFKMLEHLILKIVLIYRSRRILHDGHPFGCGLLLFECLGLRVQSLNFDAGI
jgi:hypothetical protein